ncbi:MAG: ATP-binding protein [Clostridiales Family XIII bacterium]|jgi:hypothetical protein|nr:ATP-binding protein [Clostridiales Family XIII bacterium]
MGINPFTPAFGSMPRYMAGRNEIIDNIRKGIQNGPGDPNRATIFIGSRGSGKTVLLSGISSAVSEDGWVAVNVSANDGMLESIVEQAKLNASHLLPKQAAKRIAGIQAFGFGVSIESVPTEAPSWRVRMSNLLDVLGENGTGLLISVDEVDVKFQDMVTLVSVFQHFIRERREVALIMAGLPGKVLQLFQHDSISFIRRAFQHHLGSIGIQEVKLAMRKTIESSGRDISSDALDAAAHSTGGFPFLIQLIGYYAWQQSEGKKKITAADVSQAAVVAEEKMDQMIIDNTVKEISDGDMSFLLAMLPDEGESSIADIRQRLSISSASAAQYRLRLIKFGVIEPYGRGKVQFQMPLLKKYLLKRYGAEISRD